MPTSKRLETRRLILRPPLKKDVPVILRYLSNPEIANTTLHIPYPYSKSDAVLWVTKSKESAKDHTAITFALVLKESKEMIGAMGLHLNPEHNRAEVGYWIAVPFWNQGIATEALTQVLDFGFRQLGFNKIFATHLLKNKASGRVMVKAGMMKEGKLREHYKKGTGYVTVMQYAMTASEFEKKYRTK